MSRSDSVRWECPACGNGVVTLIPMRVPPHCTKHAGGWKAMKQVQKPTK